jgi:hypothetical protein
MHLTDYIKQNPAKEFRAAPIYFPTGDFLTYLLQDTPFIAERLDDVVTIYLSRSSRELVGFKVKGVRHILKKAGDFGVVVGGGDGIRLGLFFFAGAAPDRADKLPKMKWYERLEAFADITVDRRLLCPGQSGQ